MRNGAVHNGWIFQSVLCFSLFLIQSCTEEIKESATLKTDEVSSVTVTTAVIRATIISDGNSKIFEQGFCWSTEPNPSLDGASLPRIISQDTSPPIEPMPTRFFKSIQTNSDQLSLDLFRLCTNTTYYVRAYAINEQGVAYGNEVNFTTMDVGQVLSIKTSKQIYGLCESIGLTIVNNSLKDTLVYPVCNEEILGAEQMREANGNWKTSGGYLCFESGAKQLFPQQSINATYRRPLNSNCGVIPGIYRLIYDINTNAMAGCYSNINQHNSTFSEPYQIIE